MAARSWVILTALLGITAALAGCTTNAATDDAPAQTPPPASAPAPAPEATPPAPRAEPSPPPEDFSLADSGEISGTFEKTWDIRVANVAFRDAQMHFSLASLQPGAPSTARINLALYDPNGQLVKTETVGLGAPANELTWTFTPGMLSMPGSYELKATTASQAALPSGGFASYDVWATVEY